MRYKPEHKQQTHEKIVETASREFRTHGFESVGIAKLMGDLNLTHGGFYAHFADKEALVVESSVLALDQSLDTMLAALTSGGIPAMLDFYLSEAHRDHPERGCPLPSLTAEIARHPSSTREAYSQKLSDVFDALAEQMPGQTTGQKREKVYALFAGMVGAVTLARAIPDAATSKAIMASTRKSLLRLLKEETDPN